MIRIIKDLSNNKTVLELLWGQTPLLLSELANPTELQLDGVADYIHPKEPHHLHTLMMDHILADGNTPESLQS